MRSKRVRTAWGTSSTRKRKTKGTWGTRVRKTREAREHESYEAREARDMSSTRALMARGKWGTGAHKVWGTWDMRACRARGTQSTIARVARDLADSKLCTDFILLQSFDSMSTSLSWLNNIISVFLVFNLKVQLQSLQVQYFSTYVVPVPFLQILL